MPRTDKTGKKQEKDSKNSKNAEVMEIEDALSILIKSKEFLSWQKEHPNDFFASAFTIIEGKAPEWQVCFYNPKKDRVHMFTVKDGSVEVNPESEVFKEPDKKMHKIDEKKIKIGLVELFRTTLALQKEKYPVEKPVKIIVILQKMEEDSPIIWNVTYLTQTFKTLVIKVSAEDGSIISDSILSFFSTIKP